MSQSSISTEAGDEWRDFVLTKVVKYLEDHRDCIIAEFETNNQSNMSKAEIEEI